MNELFIYELSNRIAHITLNRPEKRNALNAGLISGLTGAFKQALDDAAVKVIILDAAGEVFSAGADLAYLQQMQQNTYAENLADSNLLKDLFYTIYTSGKITIAQVEGHAIAGGCGLAAVCDFVFAVPEARFGYTEVKIGFVPAIVAPFLIRRIGEARAKELLLSGGLVDAYTAHQYGLINFIEGKDTIKEKVNAYAHNLCSSTSAAAIQRIKQLTGFIQSHSLEESLQEAAEANAQTRSTADFKKGVAAFLDGEKLLW